MTEAVIEANGVELYTEAFGDPADQPILLVMGLGASMLWWDEDFCRRLTEAGRFVIRYDHRDTGRSTTYEPGKPDYDAADLVDDAAAVLDGYGLDAAHIVGVSAGGAIAQLLALAAGDRVLSLTLISTSPAVPLDRGLPPPTERFDRFVVEAAVDWSDPTSVIDYLVGHARMLAGGQRPFDHAACRDLVHRDAERTINLASLQNHDLIAHDHDVRSPLSTISAPALVIHGTADPMFPIAHGQALADAIPAATLLELPEAGHGVDPSDRVTIASAIVEHTRSTPAGWSTQVLATACHRTPSGRTAHMTAPVRSGAGATPSPNAGSASQLCVFQTPLPGGPLSSGPASGSER